MKITVKKIKEDVFSEDYSAELYDYIFYLKDSEEIELVDILDNIDREICAYCVGHIAGHEKEIGLFLRDCLAQHPMIRNFTDEIAVIALLALEDYFNGEITLEKLESYKERCEELLQSLIALQYSASAIAHNDWCYPSEETINAHKLLVKLITSAIDGTHKSLISDICWEDFFQLGKFRELIKL